MKFESDIAFSESDLRIARLLVDGNGASLVAGFENAQSWRPRPACSVWLCLVLGEFDLARRRARAELAAPLGLGGARALSAAALLTLAFGDRTEARRGLRSAVKRGAVSPGSAAEVWTKLFGKLPAAWTHREFRRPVNSGTAAPRPPVNPPPPPTEAAFQAARSRFAAKAGRTRNAARLARRAEEWWEEFLDLEAAAHCLRRAERAAREYWGLRYVARAHLNLFANRGAAKRCLDRALRITNSTQNLIELGGVFTRFLGDRRGRRRSFAKGARAPVLCERGPI